MFKKIAAPLFAATALALTAVPAHADGSEDRARTAIAAAQAKVETAERLGAGAALPQDAAAARAALATAKEHFRADNNTKATEAAIQAQALAEASIGQLQRDQQAKANADRAIANDAIANANQQAATAQQNAAQANARANAAEHSAAVSAVEASAARDAADAAQAKSNKPQRR